MTHQVLKEEERMEARDGVLKGRNVVITGASLGIGLVVARMCHAEGARLIMAARHRDALIEAFKGLGGEGSGHRYFCIDVSDTKDVSAMADSLANDLGCIDGLVNCAGVYGPIGPTDEVDPLEFARAINVNLMGTFHMCRYMLPLLKKSGRGKVVNYSGGGAASAFPNYSAYAVSKAGVVRLSENLALELAGDRIDVNSVAPGFVATRLHRETVNAGARAGSEFLKTTLKALEDGGVPPEKAARLTVFLLSRDSDGITGKFISAPWDPWEDSAFRARLRIDRDLASLRRIDGRNFTRA
jgi:NAD(P)-dependent dehydrogenase (short-subunit alcohol dehydrogenase family)